MRKPTDSPHGKKKEDEDQSASPQASGTGSAAKGWPFAPGSQLQKQVARTWTPKPSYRFNQR